MKLASLRGQSADQRDGQLVVVSKDLHYCIAVDSIAATLQYALDHWADCHSKLMKVYDDLNAGRLNQAIRFDPIHCHSPLPRAYQWLDGSAYVNHVELVRKARNATMPEQFWHDPLMYQGGSDQFIGPHQPIPLHDEDWGIDFEGEIAVITDDVPMGTDQATCGEHIKLLALVNDVSLRNLIPAEIGKGFGFMHAKPSSSFSPVAVTPDELQDAWVDYKVALPLVVNFNDQLFGKANGAEDMVFNFARLIAHACHTRPLGAGTIIGSGTVSNKQNTEYGSSIEQGGVGYSCLAELRVIETINNESSLTPFMRFGDRIRIEMFDRQGQSIFGSIDQQVIRYP